MRYFLRRSAGKYGIFHPDLYGNNKEPCDLAFVIGRTIFLFYMKDSNLSFEKLARRNLAQAQTWLKRWHRGVAKLVGKNESTTFDLPWNAVDNIVVVSVIDGTDAGNLVHQWPDDGLKVRLAVSLTGQALALIGRLRGGIRDLVQYIEAIAVDGEFIDRHRALDLVWGLYELAFGGHPNGESPPPILIVHNMDGEPAIHQVWLYVLGLRGDKSSTILAPLDWSDIAWQINTLNSMVTDICTPGKTGPAVQGVDNSGSFLPLRQGILVCSGHDTEKNLVGLRAFTKHPNRHDFVSIWTKGRLQPDVTFFHVMFLGADKPIDGIVLQELNRAVTAIGH